MPNARPPPTAPKRRLAQLRALRYQINPHFLFNTLNSLSTLVLKQRTEEAERMILNLSNFFRTSLTSDPAADVALSDEIGMQRLYLDIEKIRFPDRLSVAVDVPADLEDARVPGMILQPLVENAIKHGVAKSSRPVTVTIRARANGGSFHLTVEDDADGGFPLSQTQWRGPGQCARPPCHPLRRRGHHRLRTPRRRRLSLSISHCLCCSTLSEP